MLPCVLERHTGHGTHVLRLHTSQPLQLCFRQTPALTAKERDGKDNRFVGCFLRCPCDGSRAEDATAEGTKGFAACLYTRLHCSHGCAVPCDDISKVRELSHYRHESRIVRQAEGYGRDQHRRTRLGQSKRAAVQSRRGIQSLIL